MVFKSPPLQLSQQTKDRTNILQKEKEAKDSKQQDGNEGQDRKKQGEEQKREVMSSSRTLVIYGLIFATSEANSTWLQTLFADSGVIDKSMEIEKLTVIKSFKGPFRKVTFVKQEDVQKILNSKVILSRKPGWQKVYINRDLSKEERRQAFQRRWERRNNFPPPSSFNRHLDSGYMSPSFNRQSDERYSLPTQNSSRYSSMNYEQQPRWNPEFRDKLVRSLLFKSNKQKFEISPITRIKKSLG